MKHICALSVNRCFGNQDNKCYQCYICWHYSLIKLGHRGGDMDEKVVPAGTCYGGGLIQGDQGGQMFYGFVRWNDTVDLMCWRARRPVIHIPCVWEHIVPATVITFCSRRDAMLRPITDQPKLMTRRRHCNERDAVHKERIYIGLYTVYIAEQNKGIFRGGTPAPRNLYQQAWLFDDGIFCRFTIFSFRKGIH